MKLFHSFLSSFIKWCLHIGDKLQPSWFGDGEALGFTADVNDRLTNLAFECVMVGYPIGFTFEMNSCELQNSWRPRTSSLMTDSQIGSH